MAVILKITLIVSLAAWWSAQWCAAQEYLPPKANGKKPSVEPVMPANYNFTYTVQESASGVDFGHAERRKEDRATGSYHVLLPDGRTQLVEYEAGPDGYKPQVMYMGTATFPAAGGDKFEGYQYAASRQLSRAAPRRAPHPAPAPAHATAPATNATTV